jgi:hypothetical protein
MIMTSYEVELMAKLVAALKDPQNPCGPDIVEKATEYLRLEALGDTAPDATRGMEYYIAIGPNCWGMGFTRVQAVKAATSINEDAKKHHIIYEANTKRTPIAYVNEMGGMSYRGDEPKEVERKEPKKYATKKR